jgi:Fic family protein
LILSYDTIIIQPPYDITPLILQQVSSISLKLGAVHARNLEKHSPLLRKHNRIKTIHGSLQIEGNTLTEEQVTALIENKRVIGPEKDIKEVMNAVVVYKNLPGYRSTAEKSFLEAHKILMEGLAVKPGKYRVSGVGIVKGSQVTHLAPPADKVPGLMKDLFEYLKKTDELVLIKSCVFHYETEFIHPFLDGNGRMGRLWQTLILMESYPVFEYLPFETLISKTKKKYYDALSKADKTGKSTGFIEYILTLIDESLGDMLSLRKGVMTESDRVEYYLSLHKNEFTRKDYMHVFKDISTATASRDLKNAVHQKKIIKTGTYNKAKYKRF